MTQNLGWFKILRHIRYKFSPTQSINFDLWNLYVFLYEQAAWDDTRELKKGQLKINVAQIKEQWMYHLYVKKIKRLLDRLVEDGYIIMTKLSKINQQGYLIEICHYDQFSDENDEKLCPTSVQRVSNECPTTQDINHQESLINNCAENEQCPTSVQRVSNECPTTECSYIEERKKKKKEELNTLPDTAAQCQDPFDEIILDDQPKKTKKPKKEKPVGKSVAVINAYQEAYFARYKSEAIVDRVTRAQACRLVERIGEERAVNVVRFYLTHHDEWYLLKAHDLKYCLADCNKLCLEMENDAYITRDSVRTYVNNLRTKARRGRV